MNDTYITTAPFPHGKQEKRTPDSTRALCGYPSLYIVNPNCDHSQPRKVSDLGAILALERYLRGVDARVSFYEMPNVLGKAGKVLRIYPTSKEN